jgi:2-keto-4-pentenoate hydratase
MASAYAIQEAAIGLWQDDIAGWKVGLVPPTERAALGTTRLTGPIFRQSVVHVARGADPVRLTAIVGGFAAIEVELVVAASIDVPPEKTQWSMEEAEALQVVWNLGVEFAASPFAKINDLGATVTVSDFGNNSGLIIGPRLDDALVADPAKVLCRTTIDTQQVGLACAAAIPGGPLEALRFLLGHLAARGRPLRAGQWVSTGAITGVHRIFPGQEAGVELVGHERIEVIVAAATPSDPRSSIDA